MSPSVCNNGLPTTFMLCTMYYLFQKFREYVLNSNRMARLQAKYDHIRMTLGDQSNQPNEGQSTLSRRPNVNRRYVVLQYIRDGVDRQWCQRERFIEKTPNNRVFLLSQLWIVDCYVKSWSNNISNENINTSLYVFITDIICGTFDVIIDNS